MKNSNIQWIGEIPDDWEVSKLKYIFDYIHRGQTPNYVEKSNCKVVNQSTFSKFFFDRDNQKFTTDCRYNDNFIRKKDVLMASTGGGVLGKVFYYDLDYNDSIADSHVTILRATNKIESKFYYYTLSILFDWINNNLAEGSTNQTELQRDLLGNSFFPLPPLATQTSIATYLDAKCSEIDGLIADINKQIETLNELKKSTITEAVTKGLNKNAKLKDSGIQWIGMIPEGWSKCRLKYLCEITTGNEDTQNADPDGEYPFYVRSPQVERCKRYTFDGEGILIAGDGAGAGRIFHHVFGKYAVHQRVYRLYNFKINTSYIHYYLSNIFPNEMDRGSAQSTVPSMRLPMLLNFNILIPSESEQRDIATYLDTKCTEFDSIISDKQKQISTLEAYKKSLIYEYVTGKNVPPV
ncbi:MAG: restriction endonuclease subunit S, partial [Bacteroidales bacterium]|nr:restriction endonuclease subunit S [Bacteroidales bacterium]